MFNLTPDQRMIVSSVTELARQEFAEDAFTWEGDLPDENIEMLVDRGYLGINIAEEYGGGGMSEFEAMLCIEAIGQVCPDTANYLYTQQLVAPRAVEMFGTDEAKERYLPPITAGESAIAIAISEPEAGSDVGSMNTSAEYTGVGSVRLTGEKTWVSNVRHADAAVVWAKFPDGFGSIIVDFNMNGIEIAQDFTNMAGHTQTQFFMNDVRIPVENILTSGEGGFKDQLRALNWERLGSATLANAIGRCALEKALEYAAQREQFGRPIDEFQGIEWKLADMAKRLEASRALTYRAATTGLEQRGTPRRLDTSLAKLFSGETVEWVTSEAMQIHGANGYMQGHPIEYLYRLARGRRLAAGTDEIQKNQIAAVLKDGGLPPLS